MTPTSLPERAGRSVVTGAVVLFAVWTLVYQVALFAQLPVTAGLVVAAVLGAGAVVVVSRLDRADDRAPATFPGAAAAVTAVLVGLLAAFLAHRGLRLQALSLGVVVALTALVVSARWAPRIEALRRLRPSGHALESAGATEGDRGGADTASEREAAGTASGRSLWWSGWAAALVSGALASVISHPDGDDAYFVNLSTWVAERGSFPLRDTMISNELFPAIQGHSPPIHSVEGLIGALARVSGLEAATVTYVLVPPVLTVIGVLVLTLLVAEARVPAAPVALLAATAFLWTAGRSGYGLGGFFAIRIWQGKAMLVAVVLPLVFLHGARLMKHGTARAHALFAASLVAAIGVSNTAAFLVPVLVAGLVLAAASLAEWRGALRLVLWTAYPLAMGVLSLVLAPASPTDTQLVAEGFTLGPVTETIDPVATVPGVGGMLVVTAVALAVGTLGVGDRTLRLGALGTIVTAGLALLPPVREVLRDVGLWSVVWRMWWAIPTTLLLAGTVGAAAQAVRHRSARPVAVAGAAAFVALVPLLGGRWVGSPEADSRIVSPLTWKLPAGSTTEARFVESISDSGDVVLVPSRTARALAALTVDVQPVSARSFYLPNYAATPGANAGLRADLQAFADSATPDDPARVLEALTVLDVRTACLRQTRDGGLDLLRENGFRDVGEVRTLICLQR